MKKVPFTSFWKSDWRKKKSVKSVEMSGKKYRMMLNLGSISWKIKWICNLHFRIIYLKARYEIVLWKRYLLVFFFSFLFFQLSDFQDCTLMALEVLRDDALNMCQKLKLEQYLSQWSVTNVWRQMEGRRRKSRFEELVSTKNRQSAKKSVRNHHNKELPIYCVFCKNNGESEKVYTSHILKSDGKILCPVSIF